jgi:DNA-binding NtrC family response regulator
MVLQPLSLLVVEDEKPLAKLWQSELARLAEATLAHSLDEARRKLRGRGFDAVLLDLHLPDGNGIDLLREMVGRGDDTATIILTGNADLNSAIQAIRLGAYDYLLKPCKITELEQILERLARELQLRNENQALRQQVMRQHAVEQLIGQSPPMMEVKRLLTRVAPSNASVLVFGETGTGKEVVARLLHSNSARSEGPFVPVNCAALPRDLAESELFGHRKGAFTGADRDHRGLIQAASGGTLLLDEIGDLPMDIQAKFLRLLESQEGRRVGDTECYHVDVRIVAATNRDLRQDVEAGRFRQDLFYRLATFELRLPPLRQIPDDLPAIAQHLLNSINVPGSVANGFSADAVLAMRRYHWPGNVRELRNVIERAKILCDQSEVAAEYLHLPGLSPLPSTVATKDARTLDEVEWEMIQQAIAAHDGNKTAAAKALGISLRTLYNRLDARNARQGE